MLCSVLIVMETIPSAGIRVQASEPKTGQEDFITDDNTENSEESSDQTKSPENSTEDAENTENLPETESPTETESPEKGTDSPEDAESPADTEDPEEGVESPDDKEEIPALGTDSVETDAVTDEEAEATENTDTENELETEPSEQTGINVKAGNTLKIGQSTTLVCTVVAKPNHPQYRKLSTHYAWYADPKGNVELNSNETSCTVTAYIPGEVAVSCSIDWTYEYYDSRVKQWRPNGGHDFQGWKLTVLAGDIVVTFDANGGTVSTSQMKVEYDAAYGTLPTPTKANSTFLGWYTEKTGGTKVEDSTKVTKFTNHTLYAHWADYYTVTFDANGGTTPTEQKTVMNTDTYGSLPYPERAGWAFDGWYTQQSGGIEITSSTIVNLTGPQTLYAHWLAVYTVTFDANGGKTPTSQKQVVDTREYGELPEPERAGWVFYGWYTQTDGGTQIMADTTAYLSGPQTLYAQWLRSYTVTFNALGGEVEPKTKAVVYARNYGELPVPSREGYEFKGWFTAVQGGTQITDETTVDVEKSHVLYAHWGFLYTVYFDANGGSVSIKSKTVPEGGCYGELPEAERTGYTFTGWYTAQTGGKHITDDTYVISRGEQTLYAHWTKNCTISFDAAGGTGMPSDMVVLKGEAARLPLAFPTMQWKSFLEWVDEYGNTYQPEDSIVVDEDMTLTARWGLKEISLNETYSVPIPFADVHEYYLLECSKEAYYTFQTKAVSGGTMGKKIELYRQETASDGTVKRTLIDSDTSGRLTKKLDKNAVYLVKISPNSFAGYRGEIEFAVLDTCTITYCKNDNYMNYQEIATAYADYNIDTGFYEITINEETPKHRDSPGEKWAFAGWTTKPDYYFSRPLYQWGEKVAVEKDAKLYTVWNGKGLWSVSGEDISINPNRQYTYEIPAAGGQTFQFTPTKSNLYRFNSTSPGYTDAIFVFDPDFHLVTCQTSFDSVSSDVYLEQGVKYYVNVVNKSTNTKEKISFGISEAYSITYDANGGEGGPSAAYKFKGENLRISDNCPTRPFYTFDKWCTTSDGKGTSYAPGAAYTADSDITLYAVWKEERNDDNTAAIPGNTCSDSFTADISEKGRCQYFEFTPEKDGDYRFAGTDGGTISGIRMALYSSSGKSLGSGSDDGKTGSCFINASFKAGDTYYLKVYAYDNDSTGTICFELKKIYKIFYEGDGEYCTDNMTGDKTGIKFHDTDMELISASAPYSTATFKANGGSCGISSAKISYVFDGWKREDTGELLYAYDMFTENISLTLTTQWKINAVPEELPQASRQNYTFAGWYTEPENGVPVTDFSTMAFWEDITLYAHWLPLSYTVSLDATGGKVSPESITVSYGNAYGELPIPTREGYVFEGWYIPHSDMKVWIGSSAIVDIAEEHTLYASWIADGAAHTVIFDAQGHGPDPKAYFGIAKGSTIEEPDKPTVKGWIFEGWYKEESCINAWDFAADVVTGDMTLYAKWTKNEAEEPENPDNPENPEDNDDSPYTDAERIDLQSTGGAIASINAKTYDGNPYEPAVKVTVWEKGRKKTLTEGHDYWVSYENNINVGYKCKVTVKGNGIYKGQITAEFQIKPKSLKKLKVIAGSMAVGDNSAPPVYLYDGPKRLVEDTDYTLFGTDGLTANAAKAAKITITGKGNYTGTVTAKLAVYNTDVSYIINPKNVTLAYETTPYTGKAIKTNEPTVKIGETVLIKNKNYKVKYQNNKNAGTAYVVVTGKGEYKGKVVKTFEIAPAEATLTINPVAAKTYNGKLQKPSVTVRTGTKKLARNRDYTISYTKNLHAGTATLTVTGKGNYAGARAQTTFDIGAQKISKASVKVSRTNGLVLTYNKRILKEGTDYTLEYGEEKGNKVKVTITGKGNFKGSVSKKVKR